MMPRSMDAGFSAGLARPPGPAGGRGFKGVIRPVVLGIAAFQVFANFEIPTAPEAGQIPGDLHGAHCRGKQVQRQRHASAGNLRRIGEPEQLLQSDSQHRGIRVGIVNGDSRPAGDLPVGRRLVRPQARHYD